MGKQKLRSKDLRALNFESNKLKSLSINIVSQHLKYNTKQEKLDLLADIATNPKNYLNHAFFAPIAEQFIDVVKIENYEIAKLRAEPKPYEIWGRKHVDSNTVHQMNQAMRLPCVEAGALMPDAHVGYGIPIGGVIATKNQLIPYAVGVDIGCRMALTIFQEPVSYLEQFKYQFKTALQDFTEFGNVSKQKFTNDHEVLESPLFRETPLLKQLHKKAEIQLGTSGSGNHFVEFGEVKLESDNELGLPEGMYLGLLTHSGSRGLGAHVAQYYTKLAMEKCKLPREVKQLAWLNANTQEGMEYWISMNLAGEYAKACHDVIHQNLTKALKLKPLKKVENHHNFAWKELDANNETRFIHRKGATPASKGEFGIIPSSMTSLGYIVSGRGKESSLMSASHGSGRLMSRSKAKESFTKKMMKQDLQQKGVTLIGGSLDEASFAYKDGSEIIKAQQDLVKVEGTFNPKIIRMDKDR
jgi:tRNA-splicing ligase RtcB